MSDNEVRTLLLWQLFVDGQMMLTTGLWQRYLFHENIASSEQRKREDKGVMTRISRSTVVEVGEEEASSTEEWVNECVKEEIEGAL